MPGGAWDGLMAILGGMLGGNTQQQQPGDQSQTKQTWLQKQQQQQQQEQKQQQQQQQQEEWSGFGQDIDPWQQKQEAQQKAHESQQKTRDYHQWTQEHANLRAQAATGWEQSQQRLLEEQRAALYTLHTEAEQLKDLIQQALKLREEQRQATLPPHPNPTQTQMTHSEKLRALLKLTRTLRAALATTQQLTTLHETDLARLEHRAARQVEIQAFFYPLAETVDHAIAKLRDLLRAARRSEAGGGCFRWESSRDLEFCVAWEGVVEGYGAVARVEEEVSRGWAAKGGRWEEYLRVVGVFGEGVRWFNQGFCGR